MQSGSETLASIEQALRDISAEESRLSRELEQANRENAEAVARRIEALRTLAAARARDALSDGVIGDADELSNDVRAILEARLKTTAQLEERRKAAEAAHADLIKRLDDLNAKIATLEEKLDRFGGQARASLKDDKEHQALLAEHERLAGMLEKADAKAKQAAEDEREKGKPYRDDPLFMYLWRRKFGTSDYRETGVVRFLDEWVAGLVRYADARANYAMLTEIPIRLRGHADGLAKLAAAAKEKVEEAEMAKTRSLAGSDVTQELKAARDEQSVLNKDFALASAELTETGNQIKTYAKGDDQSFRTAVQTYADFLDKEPLQRLIADAQRTATPEDDRAVEDISRLGEELEALADRNEERRRKLDELFAKKQELVRLSANFRRAHYDDIGSIFSDNPNLQELLRQLLKGAITAAEYWARMQSQQRWRGRAGDPWRRKSGLPPFDPWPSGGWRRSGGNRSSSSGRDFETGGTI